MPYPRRASRAPGRWLAIPLATLMLVLTAGVAAADTVVTDPTPDIECPEAYGDGKLTVYRTTVNTPPDSTNWYVEVQFTLARDDDSATVRCQLTLSTYEQQNGPPPEFPQYRFDWAGGTYGAGTHTVRADLVLQGQLPGCWSQYDFVFGPSIQTLNAGGFGARQIRSRIVGSDVCPAPPPEQVGSEGCTPGYWKNHTAAWGPAGYAPGQTLESVFDVPNSLGYDNTSLLAALKFGGGPGVPGGARILLRAAVASLLNAAHPDVDFSMTTADVIGQVNVALASNDRATMLALATTLDRANNGGCPLN